MAMQAEIIVALVAFLGIAVSWLALPGSAREVVESLDSAPAFGELAGSSAAG